MAEKRYAIVRVDKDCPKDKSIFIRRCLHTDIQCKQCYGDTKEQLIKKVMTAFAIAINENKKGNMPTGSKRRRVAEIIVEFLGVE